MISLLDTPGRGSSLRLKECVNQAFTNSLYASSFTLTSALRIQATDEQGRIRNEMTGLSLVDHCFHVSFRKYRADGCQKRKPAVLASRVPRCAGGCDTSDLKLNAVSDFEGFFKDFCYCTHQIHRYLDELLSQIRAPMYPRCLCSKFNLEMAST